MSNWLFASLKLIIIMHVFACIWILIAVLKLRAGYDYDHIIEFTDLDSHFYVYVDAWYMMTATISTVGYGDFKGYSNKDQMNSYWLIEMFFLAFVMVAGIMMFSSITNEIFNFQREVDIS